MSHLEGKEDMLENKKLLKEGRWVLFMRGLPQSLDATPWQVVKITRGGGRVYLQRNNPDTGEVEKMQFGDAMFLVYETEDDALDAYESVNSLLNNHYTNIKEMEVKHMKQLWGVLERNSVKDELERLDNAPYQR